ncbi:hypothetical protein CTAYLR_004386 [Chrysophaeum taylorii]|uniref:J domain-containing protein n=1 Tax=Chrysophaeum taylorii TaxID=2483200 RepID=A0AAD7ULS8_9STRA|nr:hypothetical protein CTAYLR_004386 [Chrysophaeum taylorii]
MMARSRRYLGVALLVALPLAAAKVKFEDKWNKFCGEPDCYTELGLLPNATKAQIRRAYRNLSLEFHPDKNPGDRVAAEKFRRVARANEVLTDDEERKKLDYYIENPAEYWQLYGSYVSYAYKPKSSIVTAIVFLLLFLSCVQPTIQYSKYSQYVAKLEKAAMNKLPVGAGGSPESLEIRRLAEEKIAADKANKKGKSGKLDRKKLEETIHQLIADLEIEGEFRKPTVREIPIVRVCIVPVSFGTRAYRYLKVEYKRFKGLDLDEEEKQEVIERFLGGADKWEALSDQDQDKLIEQDCWKRENFDAWMIERKKNAPVPQETTVAAEPAVITAKSKKELRQRRKANANKSFVMDD